jgi:peptidoglycan endopeptidase LytE
MRGRWTLLGVGLMIFHVSFALHQGFAAETYTVKPGDSLYGISKSFGIPLEALKKANSLQTDGIKPKQILQIPSHREAERRSVRETESYVVKKGDNLYIISKRAGLSADEIMKVNHLRSVSLTIGQTLILPKQKVDKVDLKVEPEEGLEEIGDAEEVAGLRSSEGDPHATPEPVRKWDNPEERHLLVRVVKTFLGAPYRLGGSTIKGIDCSAFVKKIYEIFNIHLPRTVREQLRFGKKIEKDQLAEGDLVFFKTLRGNNGHVGIYIGNNEFVHASFRNREVKVDSLTAPYFNQRFFKAVRVKELESEMAL